MWRNCNYLQVTGTTGGYNATYGSYATAIPGIGMRVTFAIGGRLPGMLNDPGPGIQFVPGNITIDLIKTGNITTGGTLGGQFATGRFPTAGRTGADYFFSSGVTVNVPAPTCTFTANGGGDVILGRHDALAFTGVGSESPWVLFNIQSTGCNASTASVHMTYRGTVNPNNAGLFAVGGPLAGVGVQLQRMPGGTAITPNGAARQTWNGIGARQDHQHRARFVQTLPTITPGTGRAAITVNIAYN
jgi:type 1 fimbria pilin